jgi:hypothetical protein
MKIGRVLEKNDAKMEVCIACTGKNDAKMKVGRVLEKMTQK